MGRPKRNEHTREKLLEQGIELLSEKGYHGTGLKVILDTVKVPKGSFYNYFESKEVYVAEIINRYSQEILDRLDEYLEVSDQDPITIIRNVYHVMIKELEVKGLKGCLIGNLAAEIGNTSTVCQTEMRVAFKSWRKRFIPLLKEAQKKGTIRQDVSAELLSDVFWSTWEGGLLKMKINSDTSHLRELLDTILDTLFKP